VTPPNGGGAGRGALLASIQGFGKKGLKKTTTVDKSAPVVDGKAASSSSGSQASAGAAPPQMAGGLGGLFANGIPQLKKTNFPPQRAPSTGSDGWD
jgi:WAS/WASL-interacting protein